MFILLFLLICIIVFAFLFLSVLFCLLFSNPLRISYFLDSSRMVMRMKLSWTPPFLKITVRMQDHKPYISVYLFNVPILLDRVYEQKGGNMDILRAVRHYHTHIRIHFGLNDPAMTGLLCGAFGLLGSYLNVDALEQYPTFVPKNEYLKIQARTNVNMIVTIINYIRLKSEKRRTSYGYDKFK